MYRNKYIQQGGVDRLRLTDDRLHRLAGGVEGQGVGVHARAEAASRGRGAGRGGRQAGGHAGGPTQGAAHRQEHEQVLWAGGGGARDCLVMVVEPPH